METFAPSRKRETSGFGFNGTLNEESKTDPATIKDIYPSGYAINPGCLNLEGMYININTQILQNILYVLYYMYKDPNPIRKEYNFLKPKIDYIIEKNPNNSTWINYNKYIYINPLIISSRQFSSKDKNALPEWYNKNLNNDTYRYIQALFDFDINDKRVTGISKEIPTNLEILQHLENGIKPDYLCNKDHCIITRPNPQYAPTIKLLIENLKYCFERGPKKLIDKKVLRTYFKSIPDNRNNIVLKDQPIAIHTKIPGKHFYISNNSNFPFVNINNIKIFKNNIQTPLTRNNNSTVQSINTCTDPINNTQDIHWTNPTDDVIKAYLDFCINDELYATYNINNQDNIDKTQNITTIPPNPKAKAVRFYSKPKPNNTPRIILFQSPKYNAYILKYVSNDTNTDYSAYITDDLSLMRGTKPTSAELQQHLTEEMQKVPPAAGGGITRRKTNKAHGRNRTHRGKIYRKTHKANGRLQKKINKTKSRVY